MGKHLADQCDLPVQLVQAVLPHMLAAVQGGRIINTSSVSGKQGGDENSVSRGAYAAAKAGVLGFTRGLAREVAPKVTVNAICPGLILIPAQLNW